MTAKTAKVEAKVDFLISIQKPSGVSLADLKYYIEEAFYMWCRLFEPPRVTDRGDPGDPRFHIGDVRCKVVRTKNKQSTCSL